MGETENRSKQPGCTLVIQDLIDFENEINILFLLKGICWNRTTAAVDAYFNTRLFVCYEQLPRF